MDTFGQERAASVETLVAILGALGVPISGTADAADALREHRDERSSRRVEPVTVSWMDLPVQIPVRTDAERIEVAVTFEDGSRLEGTHPVRRGGMTPVVELQDEIPVGYHDVRIGPPVDATTRLIRAPRLLPQPEGHRWGVFAPVHALRSKRDWGIGDLTDLEATIAWVSELGGSVVATLPILAAFTSVPFEISPYAPASRLHWSELYCDPSRAEELERSPEARDLLASETLRREIGRLRSEPHADHASVARVKRRVLDLLARTHFAEGAPTEDPDLGDYARFRAACEHHGTPWTEWPTDERDGGDLTYEEDAYRYHLYAQRLVRRQLAELDRTSAERQAGLYLDLPLGVHAHGYDVWRHRDVFALDVSGGAPPDTFFRGGQDWGFSPLGPERLRATGYAHLIAVLRNVLSHADVMRVDHVMGLHRLFWIPRGMRATEGTYVSYPAEEMWAVLSVEANRSGTVIVGEDLGTVTKEVRAAMHEHGALRSYVLQFELSWDERPSFNPVPRRALASPNTHDLPPFASLWTGHDIDLRQEIGVIDDEVAEHERIDRAQLRRSILSSLARAGRLPSSAAGEARTVPAARPVLDGCLRYLAESDAAFVVCALEDLWEETGQQNIPGTTDEHPNWRHRMRYELEAVQGLDEVVGALREIERLRRDRGSGDEEREASGETAGDRQTPPSRGRG